MLSAQVFNVYQKPSFDESIQRVETRTYYPFVKSFNNNDNIEITIQQSDVWLGIYDAALYIDGKVEKTAGTGTVSLVNNAGAFLFDTISYELNGKELDSIRDPGVASTLRGYLCYSKDDSRHLSISGWNYPSPAILNSADGTFSLRIPLAHFLNIFNDYRHVVCGKHIIRLVRARSDANCMVIEEATGADPGTTKYKLTIDTIELKVTHITPSDDVRLDLLKAIKSDVPMLMPFRKWSLHELPALKEGATEEVWSVKTCATSEAPRYVIVAFQTARKDDVTKDPTLFDNINITNITLDLNSDRYPYERMRLDFPNNHFNEAFNNYVDFYPSYMNSTLKPSLLDYPAFKNRTLFVIDCSKRSEQMKSPTADIKLRIESKTGFPANTRAYCLLIQDRLIEYYPLSEDIKIVL
jgi:hypothetical protein